MTETKPDLEALEERLAAADHVYSEAKKLVREAADAYHAELIFGDDTAGDHLTWAHHHATSPGSASRGVGVPSFTGPRRR